LLIVDGLQLALGDELGDKLSNSLGRTLSQWAERWAGAGLVLGSLLGPEQIGCWWAKQIWQDGPSGGYGLVYLATFAPSMVANCWDTNGSKLLEWIAGRLAWTQSRSGADGQKQIWLGWPVEDGYGLVLPQTTILIKAATSTRTGTCASW
jgi:hypothetical protein